MLSTHSNANRLILLGVGVGGILPTGIVMFFDFVSPFIPEATRYIFQIFGIIFILGSIVIGIFALERKNNGGNEDVFLKVFACFCIFSLGALVLTSGGPFSSPFSFHFLYLPVATGLCMNEDRRSLKQASAVCGLLFIMCVIVEKILPSLYAYFRGSYILLKSTVNLSDSYTYCFAYTAVFMIQLGITYYIANQSLLTLPTSQISSSAP